LLRHKKPVLYPLTETRPAPSPTASATSKRSSSYSRSLAAAPPAGQTWKLYDHANGKPIAMRVLPPGNGTGTLYYLPTDR
jgi:hypothetical protein